ncbi:hypothetical protein [Spelaeicoccus albus]|uniref:Uncharacterized protein n=1 Tax=Spelaeicoccus albus TaxID=1280376 RepID=A0A7Z0A9N2_9MICO|nr:hypothetical protein [Spelaeicoccus albus]NYI65915.1 hypothetical protein [Spelaeicoccus albus]
MPEPHRASRSLQSIMIVVAAVSFVALVLDIAPSLAGGQPFVPWLAWIPMIGLPIAFVAFAGLILAAIKRRKTL